MRLICVVINCNYLRLHGRGVQFGSDQGERLGHVESHIGHRVVGHRQHCGQHQALSYLRPAGLGQNLEREDRVVQLTKRFIVIHETVVRVSEGKAQGGVSARG